MPIGPIGFRFRVDDSGVRDLVRNLRERGGDLRPVLEPAAEDLVQRFAAAFERGGVRRRWRRLSRDYARRKAAEGYGGKTLIRTGGLQRSYLQQGPFRHKRVWRRGLAVGSAHPLAHLHERGAKRADDEGGRLPRRSLLSLIRRDRTWRAELVESMADYITGDGAAGGALSGRFTSRRSSRGFRPRSG